MKNLHFLQRWEPRPLALEGLSDRMLLLNLYLTQLVTLILAATVLAFERINPLHLLQWPDSPGRVLLWGSGYAALVLGADLLVSRWVPEEMTDDGGINKLLFGNRPVWHIVLMAAVVSVCEELLFRGAVQHAWGPYWTSILFAGIHIRYLRHWLMTGLVFGISYGLGILYDHTGSLWAPIVAHFLIDLIMGVILKYRKEES